MTPQLLEDKRWFVMAASIAALVVATACLLLVWRALPQSSPALWALLVMYIGSASGLILLFGRLLPIVLVKIWPGLDT